MPITYAYAAARVGSLVDGDVDFASDGDGAGRRYVKGWCLRNMAGKSWWFQIFAVSYILDRILQERHLPIGKAIPSRAAELYHKVHGSCSWEAAAQLTWPMA